MEELVDILTETGVIVGKSIKKLDAHKLNVCHGISAVGLINLEGKLLIQKRASTKKIEPSKWDLSSAGHIDLNETPKEAAIREIYEELGINVGIEELELVDTYLCKFKIDEQNQINHFTYLFVVKKDIKIEEIVIQKLEVSDIEFIDKEKFQEYLIQNKMVNGMNFCKKILKYLK